MRAKKKQCDIPNNAKKEQTIVKGLVVFDLDGTLLCTHHHSCKAAHETLKRLNLPDVSDGAIKQLIGETPAVFFQSLAPGYADPRALETLFDALEAEILQREGRLYEGVADLLPLLREEGYLLAICSNGSRDYVETALGVTNIRTYFTALFCAGEFFEKSDAVKALMQETKSPFTVMVGDGAHDARAAQESGIPFVAAGYGYGGFRALGSPAYEAATPMDVLFKIEKIYTVRQI